MDNLKDKIAFVVAFLGIVITLNPFRETLNKISLNYGFAKINILILIYISLGLLFLCVYFYALEYVKYGFKILDKFRVFKYFQVIGNTLYFLAVLSPIIYITIWGIIQIFLLIPILKIDIYATIISIFSLILVILLIVREVLKRNKELRNANIESIDKFSVNAVNEVDELIERSKWRLSIIEAYRSIELGIEKKLLDLGIESKIISSNRSFEILIRNEVIDMKDLRKIQYVRQLRNQAAHSSVEFTKKEALQIMKIMKEILPKLKTSIERVRLFEKKIFDALVGKNGLFLKHHFFVQKEMIGFDALAEGPEYNYLIEIKMTSRPAIIRSAINQLKKYSMANRLIIIVPNGVQKEISYEENARILYYDIENDKFINRDEIYFWIYGKKPNSR